MPPGCALKHPREPGGGRNSYRMRTARARPADTHLLKSSHYKQAKSNCQSTAKPCPYGRPAEPSDVVGDSAPARSTERRFDASREAAKSSGLARCTGGGWTSVGRSRTVIKPQLMVSEGFARTKNN